MILDNFQMREILSRLGGKFHQQNRTNGEVRGNKPADSLLLTLLVQLGNLLRGEPGSPYDRTHPVFDCKRSVGISRLRNRKINKHISAAPC
ncbi:hypothetical protein D3C86_1982830 [compost metagenome]